MKVISVRGLGKTYDGPSGRFTALRDVNLDVARGEIAAVIGHSGAGKSTLSKCLNLLERPTEGKLLVNGQDLTALSGRALIAARRQIGTIFQASSLLSQRTVAENVALPLKFAGVSRAETQKRVTELLQRVGLADKADNYPRALSGGQRQRVGIARALALRPNVLLADEPTSGLDPETTQAVLALLKDLRSELGLSIVLISHEMEVVREAADTATLLENGRVVDQGAVRDLMGRPESRLGRALLGERPILSAPEGTQAWEITYAGSAIPGDWLSRLARLTGADPQLLGGSLEAVGGQAAGRVILGLPLFLSVDWVTALQGWGLIARPLGEVKPSPAFAAPTSDIAERAYA